MAIRPAAILKSELEERNKENLDATRGRGV